MTRMYLEERVLAFGRRCWYRHRKTLKPTTVIAVEQIAPSEICMHRFPRWMPMGMHLCLEKLLIAPFRPEVVYSLTAGRLSIPYHIIHGLVCDYGMRDIIKFIRSLNDRRFYANTYWTSDRG